MIDQLFVKRFRFDSEVALAAPTTLAALPGKRRKMCESTFLFGLPSSDSLMGVKGSHGTRNLAGEAAYVWPCPPKNIKLSFRQCGYVWDA